MPQLARDSGAHRIGAFRVDTGQTGTVGHRLKVCVFMDGEGSEGKATKDVCSVYFFLVEGLHALLHRVPPAQWKRWF